MKLIFRFLFLALPGALFSQLNDNCINAIPLCSNPSFTFFTNSGPGSVVDFSVPASSNISNPTPNPNPPNAGCLLSGELNPQWLLLTVGNPGNLEFVFGAGNSANPQVGLYDWIMWPYSPTACAGILNNTLPPIRCNWNGSGSGGTGVASASNIAAVGGSSVNFESPIPVNACDQFIICISNFSGVNTQVSFQSLGSASLSCNPNCNPNYLICAGSTASIIPVNFAGLANPSYSIQPSGTINSTGTFVVSPTITTSYTTFITGTNANNAVQTTTAISIVTVNPLPSLSPTVTQAVCNGTVSTINLGLTFNTPGPNTNYTVAFSPTIAGISSFTQTIYTGSITPGAYSASVTTGGSCVATTNFTVNPPPPIPSFTISPAGSVFTITCANSSIVLNATDPTLNYNWLGTGAPVTSSTAVFTNLNIGTWSVTGTDPNTTCSKAYTFAIIQNVTAPTSSITPNFQLITCTNSAVQTVTATAHTPTSNVSHTFNWGIGGNVSTSQQTAIVTPPPGTHTYVLTDLSNGCTTTKTFTVATAVGFPSFTLISPVQSFSVGCVPKNVCDLIIFDPNTTPTPGGSLSFTLLTAASSTNYGFNSTASFSITAPGQYTVVTRDDVTLCETKVPVSITQNTVAPNRSVALLTQTLSCFTPSVLLVGSSETPNSAYQWSTTSGVIPGNTVMVNTTANPSTTLINTYQFIVTDNTNACKNNTFVPMYQNIFLPKALIVPQTGGTVAISCKTPSVTLVNQSSTGIPANSAFPTGGLLIGRLWEGPSPQIPKENSSNYIAFQPGTYSLTVQDMNNGCISSTVFPVGDARDFPEVVLTAANSTLDCGATSATIATEVTQSTFPVKYEWFNTNGLLKTATLTTFPSLATVTVALPGDYRLITTNETNGCVTIAFRKVVNGDLISKFSADKVSGFAPLTVNFSNNSQSSLNSLGISSVWNFGNGNSAITSPTALNVSSTYNQPGTYTVTLYANKGSCQHDTSLVISVELPSKLEVPNVFTPNEDGVNDIFFLRTANLTEIKASIYDRWGNLVYQVTSESGNIAWDGKNQAGQKVAEGTYFYIITSNGKDDKAYDTKGTVSLYR